jgi:hypothetical protein
MRRKDGLIAPAGPPVARIQELRPVKIFTTPGGDTVADMGQNMVGWVRLAVEGPAGTKVTLAARGGPGQGRQLLHREPAQGARHHRSTR